MAIFLLAGAAIAVFCSPVGLGAEVAQARAPASPEAWTTEAEISELTVADLNGVINPHGVPTSYRFEFGRTESYGRRTGTRGTYDGNRFYAVGTTVFGLREGTTYHFRVVAISKRGKAYGADKTFTTGKPRPSTPRSVIACFHPRIKRFTGETHPRRCNVAGYREKDKEPIAIPVTGISWGHWGHSVTRGAHGKALGSYGNGERDRIAVRIIAFGQVTCGDGRTWYSKVVLGFPGIGEFFILRLPRCDDPSVEKKCPAGGGAFVRSG